MMTLREFLTKVNFREHYRIYQPNRDCLIFESYYKIHSPYFFDEAHKDSWFNPDFYSHNEYCNDCRMRKDFDEETKTFLEVYGDYAVFSLECGKVKPHNLYKDESGHIRIEYVKDPMNPDNDTVNCFNVFIIPADHYNDHE